VREHRARVAALYLLRWQRENTNLGHCCQTAGEPTARCSMVGVYSLARRRKDGQEL